LERKGLKVTGTTPEGELAELVELEDHPWFIACQFHPEFRSKPDAAHPLFSGFIRAALEKNSEAQKSPVQKSMG
jgi:CTP synthase